MRLPDDEAARIWGGARRGDIPISNDIVELIKQKSVGYGVTGRQIPKSLEEQIVIKDVLKDPFKQCEGKEMTKLFKINDNRWLNWDKYQIIYRTKDGNNIVIHFNFNDKLKVFDDFKFKSDS